MSASRDNGSWARCRLRLAIDPSLSASSRASESSTDNEGNCRAKREKKTQREREKQADETLWSSLVPTLLWATNHVRTALIRSLTRGSGCQSDRSPGSMELTRTSFFQARVSGVPAISRSLKQKTCPPTLNESPMTSDAAPQ